MRAAILNYTKYGGHKHKTWLKRWFSRVPNGLLIKKWLHLTYIYGTYVRIFEQEEKKRLGSSITWNCFARSSNVDGKWRTWPLESGHVPPRRVRSHVFWNQLESKTPLWFISTSWLATIVKGSTVIFYLHSYCSKQINPLLIFLERCFVQQHLDPFVLQNNLTPP